MKSCPICNRAFDETRTFCLEDGAALSPPFDPRRENHVASGDTAPRTEIIDNSAGLPAAVVETGKRKRRRPAARKKKRAIQPERPKNQTSSERSRSRQVFLEVLKGLLFIAVVLSLKLSIEQTTFGKHLELMSYNLLQTQLSSEPPPITIVDISDLAPRDFVIAGQTVTATPRDSIKEMLTAIAGQQPRAIGVDIDFSPDENGYILPTDPEFFEFCIKLSKQTGVPIFLGVERTIAKPPNEWLGEEKYKALAANILIPKDTKRMLNLLEVAREGGATSTFEKHDVSQSMSALVANAYGRQADGSGIGAWARNYLVQSGVIERLTEKEIGAGITVQDFLIDYGALDSIETIRTTNATVLGDVSQREKLQRKIILLGDATLGAASDTFVVPGRDQPYPGTYVHSCAAYTLIKAPLYDLTGKGHLVIDFVLSGAILLAIVVLGFRYRDAESRELATNRLRGIVTWFIVLFAIVVGVLFVRTTRIMWNGFFLALLLLVFHPSIERHAESVWRKIRKPSLVSSHDRNRSKY